MRALEQGEAQLLVSYGTHGPRLRGVPLDRPRRPGWPPELRAAVEAALTGGQRRPPAGVSWGDWERVRAARAEDAAATVDDLRRRWLDSHLLSGPPGGVAADRDAA